MEALHVVQKRGVDDADGRIRQLVVVRDNAGGRPRQRRSPHEAVDKPELRVGAHTEDARGLSVRTDRAVLDRAVDERRLAAQRREHRRAKVVLPADKRVVAEIRVLHEQLARMVDRKARRRG